ncbi:MAG: hypothetical protein LC793_12225, partial [Thermomicrobia bacterium]|nr:hypothetical protein [Thermomicrobia bacterium]
MTIAIGVIGTGAAVTSTALNTIFLSYGNEINRIGPIVDAATNAPGAASALLKTDTGGGVALTGPVSAAGGVTISGGGGLNITGAANNFVVAGSASIGTTLSAGGAASFSGGVTVSGGGGINITGAGNNL